MKRIISGDLLRIKLAEVLAAPIPALTPRDIHRESGRVSIYLDDVRLVDGWEHSCGG